MEEGSIDVDPKSILEEAKKRHEKDDDGGMTLKEYINWHLEELIMAVTPAHEDFDYVPCHAPDPPFRRGILLPSTDPPADTLP